MEQNNQQTALLVMDLEMGILNTFPGAESYVGKVATAVKHAREKNILVIYVRVGFRQTKPEISMNNKSFVTMKDNISNVNMDTFMKIHPAVEPLENDVIVTKRRISAFTGSDLEVVLRAQNIHHIILAGIATSGVVLSTTREAADKDYRITILSDGCADRDEEVHRILMTKVFPRQADVITIDEWING
jgi:nicotinamidase-related amidase